MLRLRPGGPADEPALLALFDEAVTWLVARGQTGQWGSEPFSTQPQERRWVRTLANGGGLWIAEIAGTPVGALAIGAAPAHVPPSDRSELYVNLLLTSRRRAGMGIGGRLVEQAVRLAREQGVEQLRVDCWAGAPRLVRWYEDAGFTRSDTFELDGWRGQVFAMELA